MQSGQADADGFDGQDTLLATRPAGGGGGRTPGELWSEDLSWLALVHAPLLVTTPDGLRVRAATAAATCLLGVAPEGMSLRDLFGASAAAQLQPLILGVGPTGDVLLPCATPRGLTTLGFRAEALPLTASGHGGVVLTVCPPDATAAVHRQAQDWAHTLEAVTDGLPVGVVVFDAQFRELFANRLAHEFMGFDDVHARRTNDDWWVNLLPDPVQRAAAMAKWRAQLEIARLAPEGYVSMEEEVTCRDGQRRNLQVRYRFIGDIYVAVFWDVTERRRLEEGMRRLAVTDDLTGLFNRRGFSEHAQAALAAAGDGRAPVSLLMLDVDHFKQINDHYGHSIGDRVLEEIARRCRLHLRPQDVLARLGGEEFAAVLPATSRQAAYDVAQGLLEAIGGTPMQVGAVSLTVRASIGVAAVSLGGDRLDDVMERADRALYAAKASGRNRVVLVPGPF